MITATLFDLDGVIVDSEPVWRRVEQAVAAELGHRLSEEDCLATKGLRIDEVMALWRDEWGGDAFDPAAVGKRVIAGVMDVVSREDLLLAGVRHAVSLARRRSCRLAVASSSPRLLIEAVLRRYGLREMFDEVASAAEERLGKPDPAVFLTAARLLGAAPGECLVIEDSSNGVLAAKAAGMRCLAVPEPGQPLGPGHALADATIHSLEVLDDELWDRLAA